VTRFCINCGADISHKIERAKWCSKKCNNEAWYAANPEKVKAIRDAWKAANPEKAKAATAAWRAANPEKVKARHDAWKAANPEKMKAYNEAYNLQRSVANALLKDIVPPAVDENGRIDPSLTASVRIAVARANNLI
jgi:hypothetical protein